MLKTPIDSRRMDNIDSLKYPIGKLTVIDSYRKSDFKNALKTLEAFPAMMERAIFHLGPEELKYRYRPEGWTISEVLQHCVDSHINAFWRIKMALTEENPEVPNYKEGLWVQQADGQKIFKKNALDLLKALHSRWVFLLENLSEEELQKGYYHSGLQRVVPIWEAALHYDWHCRHHLAHILTAKIKKF